MKQLFLDGFEVDISQDIALPITYSISDIKKPQSRKQSVSKQSTLLGTSKNMVFFRSVYSLSVTNEKTAFAFDPTIRINAILKQDGNVVFKGFFRVDEVEIVNKTYEIKFTLYNEVVDFFKQLSEIKLNELDWSEYDHQLTTTNISNSWTTSVKVNGSDVTNFTAGVPDAFGYLYGIVDNGSDRIPFNKFSASDMIPQVYFKEAIEKAFNAIGLRITNNLDDLEIYKRLVVGGITGNIPTIDNAEIGKRLVDVEFDGGFTFANFYRNYLPNNIVDFTANLNLQLMLLSKTTNSDFYTQQQSGKLVVARTGSYSLALDVAGDYDWSIGAAYTPIYESGSHNLQVFVNGVIKLNKLITTTTTGFSGAETISLDLTLGDELLVVVVSFAKARYTYDPTQSPLPYASITYTDVHCELDLVAKTSPVNFGDTIRLNTLLPAMKCSELFETMVKLFNCYFEAGENGITITPLNDFYEGTADAEEWSDKVDYSKPIKIKSANFIEGKTYKYEWLEDNDYYNDLYQKETGRKYGDKTHEISSPFKQSEVIFKLPFAPTVLAQKENQPLVMPTIIAVDNGVIKRFKGKPRLYLYSGLRTGAITVQATNYSTYPQLGHFLDVDNPTYDINFDLPDKLYYNITSITNANTFNTYHSKLFRENTNKDSKQLTCSVFLSSKDIKNLSFALLKNIDGVPYRLNEVKEVDTGMATSFECELIKVIEADSNQTYTGLPAPDPPLDNTSTYRLLNNSIQTDNNISTDESISTYLIDTDSGDVNFSLELVAANTTISVKNIGGNGNVVIFITANIDGVSSPTIADGVSWTIFFDGNKYYRIQ